MDAQILTAERAKMTGEDYLSRFTYVPWQHTVLFRYEKKKRAGTTGSSRTAKSSSGLSLRLEQARHRSLDTLANVCNLRRGVDILAGSSGDSPCAWDPPTSFSLALEPHLARRSTADTGSWAGGLRAGKLKRLGTGETILGVLFQVDGPPCAPYTESDKMC